MEFGSKSCGDEIRVLMRNFSEMDGFLLALDQRRTAAKSEDCVGGSDRKLASGNKAASDSDDIETCTITNIHHHQVADLAAAGKGLSGTLKLLKERGDLKQTVVEWRGRNMDKKKSRLRSMIYNEEGGAGVKEINIDRRDEYGRILTPKESFRLQSHIFHGKKPGINKQRKRMRQDLLQEEEEFKVKQSDHTPTHFTKRMREAQVQLKSPYIVLSSHF